MTEMTRTEARTRFLAMPTEQQAATLRRMLTAGREEGDLARAIGITVAQIHTLLPELRGSVDPIQHAWEQCNPGVPFPQSRRPSNDV